ncbi:270_t:CDS:10 [Entrophospora sp. SA101]|nr:270_t:CDS:10 [Entrophospora sp. SA101]
MNILNPPSLEDIERVIKQLPKNKAAGHNFAAEKYTSTITPIQILNNTIEHVNQHKITFIHFFQDMSKAFDNVDHQRLKIALKCIEQGDPLSPIIWKIFYDPILAHITNNYETDLLTIKTTSLEQINMPNNHHNSEQRGRPPETSKQPITGVELNSDIQNLHILYLYNLLTILPKNSNLFLSLHPAKERYCGTMLDFLRILLDFSSSSKLQFSPFFENKMACVTAANFGLVGNGRLFIINTGVGPNGIDLEKFYDTQDGLFDCCWSELNEHQIVTASGDGSIKLWDITLMEFPIMNWHEHSREVFSVNWNLIKKDCFISGSWDSSIKLWRPELRQSILTYNEHTNCVYSTIWSPYNPDIFGPVSGDQLMKIWDTKVPTKSVQTIHGHLYEILFIGLEQISRKSICDRFS